jgi:hypothetical protein
MESLRVSLDPAPGAGGADRSHPPLEPVGRGDDGEHGDPGRRPHVAMLSRVASWHHSCRS